MTTRRSSAACALIVGLVLALSPAAHAQRGGHAEAPAPAPRSAPPPPRPAAPARPAPVAPPAGFNLRRDIAQPAAARAGGPPPQAAMPRTGAPAAARPSFTATTVGGPFHDRFKGPVIRNARVAGSNYGWNHGIPWRAAPIYWGGGFWGSFAIASLGSYAAYGAFEDDQDQVVYPSYQVDADTPGADLLADYQLQQTPCGPPNLVVIWGPDNSVICAIPNDLVGPGDYEVDPQTFTLISAAPP